jgi:hypothetical protein
VAVSVKIVILSTSHVLKTTNNGSLSRSITLLVKTIGIEKRHASGGKYSVESESLLVKRKLLPVESIVVD